MDEIKKLIKQVEKLSENEQYKEIITLLTDEILEKHDSADLYSWQAKALKLEEVNCKPRIKPSDIAIMKSDCKFQ